MMLGCEKGYSITSGNALKNWPVLGLQKHTVKLDSQHLQTAPVHRKSNLPSSLGKINREMLSETRPPPPPNGPVQPTPRPTGVAPLANTYIRCKGLQLCGGSVIR